MTDPPAGSAEAFGNCRGDQRALEAAVDYIAGLGGGTVEIGPGELHRRTSGR